MNDASTAERSDYFGGQTFNVELDHAQLLRWKIKGVFTVEV